MPEIAFVDLAAQRQRISNEIDAAISRVLAHGGFIMGPEVREFEAQLAQFGGARFAVSCANGTDALTLCLMAEEIGPGDGVVVPSFTFIATAEAVAERGATPVFCDVDKDTFNIDIASLMRAIGEAKKKGLRPRAVISVDMFGLPADHDNVRAIAEENGLLHISDAAQSFGASYNGKRVGTFGAYTTTSFFPSKPLGCYGDGGAILTDDEQKATVLDSLRVHGKGHHKYDNVRVGMNSRLDTLQAAILLEKIRILEGELKMRSGVAQQYHARLSNRLKIPIEPAGRKSAWAQYTLRLDNAKQRARVQSVCKDKGVPTAIYYPNPLHLQTGYKDLPCDPAGLEVAEELSNTVLSLPMHPYLTNEMQDTISDAVIEALS